ILLGFDAGKALAIGGNQVGPPHNKAAPPGWRQLAPALGNECLVSHIDSPIEIVSRPVGKSPPYSAGCRVNRLEGRARTRGLEGASDPVSIVMHDWHRLHRRPHLVAPSRRGMISLYAKD